MSAAVFVINYAKYLIFENTSRQSLNSYFLRNKTSKCLNKRLFSLNANESKNVKVKKSIKRIQTLAYNVSIEQQSFNYLQQTTRNFYFDSTLFKMNNDSTTDVENSNIFQGKIDRFNGVIVSSALEPCCPEEFPNKLIESLKAWTECNRRGIWFKVATEHADWVPVLVKNGFRFHHAREHFVMLCKWLPKDAPNIPNFAHTLLGVGAIVVNDKNQVLVVREKYFIYQPHWKFPGGYIEPGENIVDAGIREVKEETGIKTEFHSLVAVRHIHKAMFECSDIYFVLCLKALTEEIKKCDREIEACIWTDIDKFLEDPNTHETNRLFLERYLENKKNNFQIEHLTRIQQATNKEYYVFAGAKEK